MRSCYVICIYTVGLYLPVSMPAFPSLYYNCRMYRAKIQFVQWVLTEKYLHETIQDETSEMLSRIGVEL